MMATHDCKAHDAQTRRVMVRSLGIEVTDFQCRARRHPLGADEYSSSPSIVFVRRGVFIRTQNGESTVADSGQLLFFNPDVPYRIAHPVEGGDDCTIWLTLPLPFAQESVARHAPRAAEHRSGPFQYGHSRLQLNLWRVHYRLISLTHACTELVLQDFLLDLIDRIIKETHARDSGRRRGADRRSRQQTARRHRAMADEAVIAIHRNLAEPPALCELAASFNCSPYHLSRVFHDVVGSSLREYVAAARARAASAALARGARNLTDLALPPVITTLSASSP